MTIAVTFDFHDTLASCDRWFEVEVFTLVPEVLRWLDARHGTDFDLRHRDDSLRLYRELRGEVISCGNEIDAVACTRMVLDRLGIDVEPEHLRESVDAVMRATLDDTHPVPGAIEAVRFLAERGIPVGIVSSAVHHEFLEWTLERFGITDAISAVITSASCGYYKSRSEIYSIAVQQLGVCPDRCVHIGDSYQYDVLSARLAGLHTIWFRRSGAETTGLHSDVIVDTLCGVAPRALSLLGVSR